MLVVVGFRRQQTISLTTTDFITLLENGRIRDVRLSETQAKGTLNLDGIDDIEHLLSRETRNSIQRSLGSLNPSQDFICPNLTANASAIARRIDELNASGRKSATAPKLIQLRENPQSGWILTALSTVFPILLIVGLWIFFLRQMQAGGRNAMSFGKSRARLNSDNDNKVTFDNVAGCDEAKEELREVVEFLKDPQKFQRLGAKIPKGVLLFGAPGTGKTLLAKAVAGEANVPFFSISGSDFVEMFVGVGAARVRDLFEQGKKNAPCIIFIDEIDAVGRQRFAGLGGGHDEREQTLNQLLVEMDGFSATEEVILVAATNRPDVLDPALLRPGRFDRQISVDPPDVKGREEILRVHTRNVVLDKSVDLKVLARRTPGFSGADLANAVNEAALLAARRNKDRVDMQDFEDAVDRVMAGPEKRSKAMSEKEKRIVAYHEAGHALMYHFLEELDPLHKVSILPRGRALGYTMHLPTDDKFLTGRNELLGTITALLGGRVAEEIALGEITTGASNDLERATALAHRIVCEWGMSHRLGPITFGKNESTVFLGRDIAKDRGYSEEIAFEIDKEIRRIVDECYARSRNLLETHRNQLDMLASALLEREVLDKQQVELLFEGQLPPFDNNSKTPALVDDSPQSQSGGEKRIEDLPSSLGNPAPSPA
ncbi:MAG: ATP-dependent zinc metalloprotease FtsH [Candidatus Omnitrophica bacterium]|nr:ATP-dependent zinc metalloprotease FtsH [bacterium]MBV6480591.1 ATP-dependent zinc metalloprotease FtsH [bacterium]MCC6731980.1 ATP-dependent zinc metalloprotease FtsH [Candidatus Omnitrophota bacterium]MCE7907039.1 ATP-dependent zinc metalloprotease FtsH [Candidatus Omnitrophica bacterium COP1]MCL4734745.1 ATP-dependent zinc metalloprotease FtsH [Candidatus Omnitrophota bacterium]